MIAFVFTLLNGILLITILLLGISYAFHYMQHMCFVFAALFVLTYVIYLFYLLYMPKYTTKEN